MIPHDFEYYRPGSIDEAIQTFHELNSEGKDPIYYGGGTEIISMARVNSISPSAVIDIKAIPECNLFEFQNDQLVIGAATTLTKIAESNLFPLMGKVVSRIADHTIQGKITLGGNICGTIIYNEALLPLFLSDSLVLVACKDGNKEMPITRVFNENLLLEKGDLIVKIILEKEYITLPHIHMKKTKLEKINYPLLTIAALKKNEQIRIALSGLCPFPFRSLEMENNINNKEIPLETRLNDLVNFVPAPILNDLEGSREYRELVLKNTVAEALTDLGGM